MSAAPKFKNPRARYNYQGRSVSITGVGAYVPAKVLTNFELAASDRHRQIHAFHD